MNNIAKILHPLQGLRKSNENKGDNVTSIVNQQVSFMNKKGGNEKFCYYLGGFIEGEGSLWASVVYDTRSRFHIKINFGFSLYQHISGLPLLEAAKHLFKTGRIYMKPGSNDVYVFEINSRPTLFSKVLPFFKHYVLPLGCKFTYLDNEKKGTYQNMLKLLELFDQKQHMCKHGIIDCVKTAYNINPHGKGKKRKRTLEEVLAIIQHSQDLPKS